MRINYQYFPAYDHKVEKRYLERLDYTELAYINWYIRSGSVQGKINGKPWQAGPGDWVFADPLMTLSHTFSDASHIISIWFRVRWNGLDFIPPRIPLRIVPGSSVAPMLRQATSLCAYEARFPQSENIIHSIECKRQALFYAWLVEWQKARENQMVTTPLTIDPRTLAMMDILLSNPLMAPVNYELIGEKIGISRTYCNRLFKQDTGMTPCEWRAARCMDKAQEMVDSATMSMKEIAYELGFFDASHFTKWFKTKTGQTPSERRKHAPPGTRPHQGGNVMPIKS